MKWLTTMLTLSLPLATLAEEWTFHQSRGAGAIDVSGSGQIVRWEVGGKVLVQTANPSVPVSLTLVGSEPMAFEAKTHKATPEGVTISGMLKGAAALPGIPARLHYSIAEEGARIDIRVETDTVELPGKRVEAFGWALPLALQPRKKVAFRGEHGMEWETRYFYQFMIDSPGRLLPRPDRNEWRYFGLDQLGPKSFRLWRSESDTTSPLVMQEGESAAPWMQLFDRRGGILVTYPDLARHAPASLRADAAGGGTARVAFHSRASQPIPASQLPGISRRISLQGSSSEAGAIADRQKAGGPEPVALDPAVVLEEPEWVRTAPLTGRQMVTGGYPFPAGAVRDAGRLRVEAGGKVVPSQSRALAYWPDGSVKWALLTFPIDPSDAAADCPAPRVSLRDGRAIPVRITPGEPGGPASEVLTAKENEGVVEICNGDLAVTLGTGKQWLRALSLRGKSLLRPEADAEARADFQLAPEGLFPMDLQPQGGTREEGRWVVDRLALEDAGPLRAVVRLEGMTTGREPTRVILRIEAVAGRPELRLSHTTEFRFKDPRRSFLTRLGVEIPLLPSLAKAIRFPDFDTTAAEAAELVQITPVHSELREPGRQSRAGGRLPGWIEGKDEAGGQRVVGAIRNFWQQAPNAVALDAGTLRFDLWPEAAGAMDVRRYSDYPHRAQGEAVGTDDDWVATEYYTKDPFAGISRTGELLLAFPEKGAPGAEAFAADFQSPPLLYAGHATYADAAVILPSSTDAEWPRAWEAWTRLAQFWLWHREQHGWYGKWTFGDFRHLFRSGYGWITSPDELARLLKEPADYHKAAPRPGRAVRKLDYRPANDWAFDNGRWGWGNTEGLPGLFLQHEYLRHGNRAVFFAAEAMARQARDVVTRHEGHWFGRGTRHGVQPWSDGNHEERQTTITEYRLHYLLSGDPRSRDVIEKLYREIYSQIPVTVDAAHSGRLGGLLFHWELSGSPEEGEVLRRYTRAFLSPQGIVAEPSVSFPTAEETAPPRKVNSGTMFFHAFGGLHALLEYQQITGDVEIREALIRLADHVLADPVLTDRYARGKISGSEVLWPVVAFAAHHADAPERYRAFLKTLIATGARELTYLPVTQNPSHWSGPTGYMAKNVPFSLFWVNWASYTTSALGSDPVWSPAVAAALEPLEKEGAPANSTEVSWQDEFDHRPEFQDYLDTQQPWKKK